MVAPVNDFDVTLQAETKRTLAPRSGVILSATAQAVLIDGSGNGSPSVITLVATPLTGTVGSVVFSTSPTVPLSIDTTGLIATLNAVDMGTSSVVVTVTATINGLNYTDSRTISRVTIGSLGYTGALNATRNNTAQGLLSARPAGTDGDFYFATDNLTLYQKISGSWQAAGNNFTDTNQLTDGKNLGQTATWGGVSGNGKPADNASSDVTLIGRGVTVTGNRTVKTAGTNAWDSDAYSADSYTGGAYAQVTLAESTGSKMFGLNADPATDSTFSSIDYAFYVENGVSFCAVYNNGNAITGQLAAVAMGDVLAVVYDGSAVRYLKNGVVLYTQIAPANLKLFFDSSFYHPGAAYSNIRFGPMSSNNWVNVGNRPQDTQNLILRSSFEDGAIGGWTANVMPAVVAASGQAFSKCLNVKTRDAAEDNGKFPVTPGETLYVEAWINSVGLAAGTVPANYPGTVGVGAGFIDSAGKFITWKFPAAIPPNTGWTKCSGSMLVPAGAVLADSWVNISLNDGVDNFATGALVSNMRISRFQSGATVGATLGVNVGGQITNANAATLIANAAISGTLISTITASQVVAANLQALSATIGTLRTATTGGRVEISDNVIKVFDSNALRVKLGNLSL